MSPPSELYRSTPGILVRSAGIDARAAHLVDEDDLEWADLVVTFEPRHGEWIAYNFTGDLPQLLDLGIPDDFVVDDPGLIRELEVVLTPVLGPSGPRKAVR